jgi:hypothetical protein
MKKTLLSLLTFSVTTLTGFGSGYEIPSNLRTFYLKAYPQTESLEAVATAAIDGNSYYIIWGYSKSGEDGPDDTEGAFKISANGDISQIDGGNPAALPFYYLQDAKLWQPLVKSFIQFEIAQAGGREKFQESLLQKPFIAQQLAEAYQSEGFTLGTNTKLLKNVEGEIAE